MAKIKKSEVWADGGIPKLFVGRYDSKVYCGGRICISSEWRAKLNGDSLVAARDVTKPNAVSLIPESLYEKELVAMQDKDYPEEQRASLLAAKRHRLDVRSRVKLSDEFLRLVGGGGQVTHIGCIRKIRIFPYIEQSVADEDTHAGGVTKSARDVRCFAYAGCRVL